MMDEWPDTLQRRARIILIERGYGLRVECVADLRRRAGFYGALCLQEITRALFYRHRPMRSERYLNAAISFAHAAHECWLGACYVEMHTKAKPRAQQPAWITPDAPAPSFVACDCGMPRLPGEDCALCKLKAMSPTMRQVNG